MGHYIHHPFFGIRTTFGTNQDKFCLVNVNEYYLGDNIVLGGMLYISTIIPV